MLERNASTGMGPNFPRHVPRSFPHDRALPRPDRPGILGPAATTQTVDPSYTSWIRQPIGTRIVMRSRTVSEANTITTTTETTLKKKGPELVTLEIKRVTDATGKRVVQPEESYDQRRLFPLMGGMKKEDVGKPSGSTRARRPSNSPAGRSRRSGTTTRRRAALVRPHLDLRRGPGRLVKTVTKIPQAGTTITVELTEWETPRP
ncbi:MAG: hypothetical protein U0800_18725 [Isosphaeraceae bacterium]